MGVLSSTGLDIYRNIFGFDDKVIEVNYEENDDNDDKLCDFFSKYLRCPLPILLYLGINIP